MKHKHHDVIVQWANGAQIEYRQQPSGKWVDSDPPAFLDDYEYRVKSAKQYPETSMTDDEMRALFTEWSSKPIYGGLSSAWRDFANAAIRHAIDNGQVVTREEFDRLTKEHMRATRTLDLAGYMDLGGELWQPPLGDGNSKRRERDMAIARAVGQFLSPSLKLWNMRVPDDATLAGIISEVNA